MALETNERDGRHADESLPAEAPSVPVPGPDQKESDASPGDEEKSPGPAETAVVEKPEAPEEHVQKRIKRTSRKELLELIQRKNAVLAELKKEVETTKQQLAHKEDRLLRLAAEFENFKKRTRREWELLQRQANADLIREIVWGLDNFDRAFANLDEADVQFRDGLRMIHNGFMDILRKAGVTEIDALHQKFDPAFHEAVGEAESTDAEEGHVEQVVQRGYRLHDIVLRPARVLVSKRKAQTDSS